MNKNHFLETQGLKKLLESNKRRPYRAKFEINAGGV